MVLFRANGESNEDDGEQGKDDEAMGEGMSLQARARLFCSLPRGDIGQPEPKSPLRTRRRRADHREDEGDNEAGGDGANEESPAR